MKFFSLYEHHWPLSSATATAPSPPTTHNHNHTILNLDDESLSIDPSILPVLRSPHGPRWLARWMPARVAPLPGRHSLHRR
eukprot:scaffold139501_cov28-Tisochrysis_lutea.AAC.1